MLKISWADTVIQAELDKGDKVEPADIIQSVVKNPRYIAAVKDAIANKPTGDPKPGPSHAQVIRLAMQNVLSEE